MAAIFALGTETYDSIPMHPFFAAGPNRSNAQLRASQHAFGLRRSLERVDHNRPVHMPALKNMPNDENSYDGNIQNMQTDDGPQEPISSEPVALNEHAPNDDLISDPNNARRKRQKTNSTDSEALAHAQTSGAMISSTMSRGQLEEAATHSPTAKALPTSSTPSLMVPASSPEHSPAKPRRSPRTLTTRADPQTLHAEYVDESPPAARLKATDVKSRKKMLKLGASGKLVSPSKPLDASPKKLATRPASSVQLKHGKLASSLQVTLRYGTEPEIRNRVGFKIEDILKPPSDDSRKQAAQQTIELHSTHPFFLGKGYGKRKVGRGRVSAGTSVEGQESERETSPAPPKSEHVDWKDIVFGSKKVHQTRNVGQSEAIWPPKDLQHIGRSVSRRGTVSSENVALIYKKQKGKGVIVHSGENILSLFQRLRRDPTSQTLAFTRPERQVLTAHEVQSRTKIPSTTTLGNCEHELGALADLYQSLGEHVSPVDLAGLDYNTDWMTKYCPQQSSQVLQPQCKALQEWLSQLSVRNVKGTTSGSKREGRGIAKGRKKRRLQQLDDLDDFIASSDEDLDAVGSSVKNAILITGPSGCGKTAAILAAANELNFEVFEINPGMRRSAKDVFDKVGNMTQNHLVKSQPQLQGRQENTTKNSTDQKLESSTIEDPTPTFVQFKADKGRLDDDPEHPTKERKVQKESLVLFEEVDILFEDDKSFWSGVTALIEQSRRPVVLTCNELHEVPVDELPLHAILEFSPPPVQVAGPYLTAIAAKEGHLLDPDAVSTLYESNRRDLRASLAALQFWCQMTLGSHQGGLDWMLDPTDVGTNKNGSTKIRVMSRDTYVQGLDLAPSVDCMAAHRNEEVMRLALADFDLHPLLWHHNDANALFNLDFDQAASSPERLDHLEHVDRYCDALSLFDLAQPEILPLLSACVQDHKRESCHASGRAEITEARLASFQDLALARSDMLDAFEHLKTEKPVFPPAIGRLAPSLEGSSAALPVDIAPYVRSIVAFDQRLERKRIELAEVSVGTTKTRTTRAARAALEGGSKANTRRERWFSPLLNSANVLRTGGAWPLWRIDAPNVTAGHSEAEGPSNESSQDNHSGPISMADRESPNQGAVGDDMRSV